MKVLPNAHLDLSFLPNAGAREQLLKKQHKVTAQWEHRAQAHAHAAAAAAAAVAASAGATRRTRQAARITAAGEHVKGGAGGWLHVHVNH
jgi:hypothetical protein